MPRRRTKVVEQEATIAEPKPMLLRSRRAGTKYQTDVLVKGRYVGQLKLNQDEYEQLIQKLVDVETTVADW